VHRVRRLPPPGGRRLVLRRSLAGDRVAGTRFLAVVKGPNSNGRGKVRIAKKLSIAKALGTTILRIRIPGAKARAFLADGASLGLEIKVRQPGTKKSKLLKQTFSLR
jgi:hypothetical protein